MVRMVRLAMMALLLRSSAAVLGQAPAAQEATPPVVAPLGVPGSAERPVRISSGVMAGLILHKVQPEYPWAARDTEGAVVMAAKIDDKGKVVDFKVMSGPEMLRGAALNAVKQWTYKPYLLNGQPVFLMTTITVMFTRSR